MQKKFGTVLDDKILADARAYCVQHGTSISHLLETALTEYLERYSKRSFSTSKLSTIDASFGVLKISPAKLKSILQEDMYET